MLWVSTTGFWNVLLLFLLLSLRYVGAMKNNRTVDDALGNSVTAPVFFPPGEPWQHQDCLGCPFQVDRARAFNGTWSAGITDPHRDVISVALSFKGTAIYIFFITPNQIQAGNFTTLMESDFTLDGQQRDTFQHVPDGSQDIQYDVLAFHMMDLPNIDHTVRFTTPVNSSVLLIFDYAIYTFDDGIDPTPITSTSPPLFSGVTTQPGFPGPSSTPEIGDTRHKLPIGTIIGGTVGGLGAALGIILLLYIYRDKKNKQSRQVSPVGVDPFTHHPAPTNELGFNSSLLAFIKSLDSRRSIGHGISRRFEKPSLHPPTNLHIARRTPRTGDADPPSTNRQLIAPVVVDDAFRARQMDLERQLHAVEEELREIGPEPIHGPSDLNIPPAVFQTSMYNEYQHSQVGTEEPLPEYSDRGTRFLDS